jgi:hypothetical protein
MQAARLRLYLAAVLFIAWIGWLGYLAFTSGTQPISRIQPIVLSRAQFLVSTLDVIAEIGGDEQTRSDKVTIKEVHWPASAADELKNATIRVTNLSGCDGWQGPGEYILALVPDGKDYQVAATPVSPGFPPHAHSSGSTAFYRIYKRTVDTMAQLATIAKPEVAQPLKQ